MRYGHFDDPAREYVIERPDTPRSWTNYLGSTEYGAIITNNAGGYSFYKSAAQGRFTRLRFNSVPMDQPGRYIYLRDDASADYWSASWQPVGKPLTEYKSECRHGTAYTTITSEYSEIRSTTTYFVPVGKDFEIWHVQVTNAGSKERKLSAFTYLEFATEWNNYQDLINLQFTQYTVKMKMIDGIIQCGVLDNVPPDPENFENRDQCRHSFLALVNAEVAGFDTSREKFLGGYRSYKDPLVVESGACTGSLAHGDNACGTLHTRISLAPGETKEFWVLLGVGTAKEAGAKAIAEFNTADKVRAALAELKEHWHSKLGRLTVETPDADFNSMINVWNAYNCLITYAWSRAASLVYSGERDGLGYRDTVQDILGVLPAIAEEAGSRLELMITGQCSTGGAMPVVKPFAHRPGHEALPHGYRSDDCLWLFNTVPAFVKETGNLAFYDKVLPYADVGQATVLGHLRRALEFNLERTGNHGLPCGLEADWNDCIRLGERGESVFVAMQVRFGLTVYSEICERLGRAAEARWALAEREKLDTAIQTHAWDGNWFIRAFREDGIVFGSKESGEGFVWLNPQSWSVLSGAASKEQASLAMSSANRYLATEFGLAILDPPYRTADTSVIRAMVLNEGQKENAGIFCHPQGWAVIAETMLGHNDRAYEYYRAYMPAAYNDRAEVRQIEPYVHCQSTHSKYSGLFGASRLPWLSGTASWSYFAATQHILGIQPDYDGLRLAPCLPSHWEQIRVTRTFRGKHFDIRIKNGSAGSSVKSVTLNGRVIEGNLLPADQFKDHNEVSVVLS
jgi:N,N'-diacetylchitobiose phosphorylase